MSLMIEQEVSLDQSAHSVKSALALLRVEGTDALYRAAYPGYDKNFSRDSFLYGMLAGDKEALIAQIDYSAQHQGVIADPETGEEPGKIHHEFPSGQWRGRSTVYNACDTTALFLLAIARLHESGNTDVMTRYKENVERGVDYIKSHIQDDLFYESPAFCGAENFGLSVTYWRDSKLNGPYEEPQYPIVYTLAHFQNAAALDAIGRATNQPSLRNISDSMMQTGITQLWSKDHFITARDAYVNDIDPPSSDSMHALLYIDPNLLPTSYAQSIEKYMFQLETEAGYRAGLPVGVSDDDYHTRWLWTHEQALLHAAAGRHGLEKASAVAIRVLPYLIGFPELIDPVEFKPAGNATQLWSIGQRQYFGNPAGSYL